MKVSLILTHVSRSFSPNSHFSQIQQKSPNFSSKIPNFFLSLRQNQELPVILILPPPSVLQHCRSRRHGFPVSPPPTVACSREKPPSRPLPAARSRRSVSAAAKVVTQQEPPPEASLPAFRCPRPTARTAVPRCCPFGVSRFRYQQVSGVQDVVIE
ncbi:hypothetical protein AAHA92_24767 [Salvia divinorum]|uniref:Uncharacterized protein n=1 Tax=Salvia divinorum TaxID=28513 RepID=A0ABD1G8F7_SALDI